MSQFFFRIKLFLLLHSNVKSLKKHKNYFFFYKCKWNASLVLEFDIWRLKIIIDLTYRWTVGWIERWVKKCALPITFSITMKVKNNHAHVTTQKILNKIHWNKLFCGMYGLAMMVSIPRLTTSKNIDEIPPLYFISI